MVVIGIDPSESKWLKYDESRMLLYDTVIRAGVGGCHLTDCFKERSFRKTPPDRRISQRGWNLEILREEIDIIQPNGLIAIGVDAEKFLYDTDFARKYSIYPVIHFGAFHYHRVDEDAWKDRFRREFAGAVRGYKRYATKGEIEGLSEFLASMPSFI